MRSEGAQGACRSKQAIFRCLSVPTCVPEAVARAAESGGGGRRAETGDACNGTEVAGRVPC